MPAGDFEAALLQSYLDLATAEREEGDWRDADVFLARAELLSQGEAVMPERPEDRQLDPADTASFATAREELLEALGLGGRVFAPEQAAEAQAAFDCWIQEAEEGRQAADIDLCRVRFVLALRAVRESSRGSVFTLLDDRAGATGQSIRLSNPGGTIDLAEPGTGTRITAVDAAPAAPARLDPETIDSYYGDALAAEPELPDRFTLYFETGTTDLTPESIALVDEVLTAIDRRTGPRVDVIGHADRVGPANLNATLSLRRANLVRQRLVDAGVNTGFIETDSYGESDPVVPTPDEVAEPLNRRVEIVVR